MTLLEAPEVAGGAADHIGAEAIVLPIPVSARARGGSASRSPRGARSAGLVRLQELERRALALADDADGGARLTRGLEALFAEVRGLLCEQFADLDHCLKQAYGPRPMLEMPEPELSENHAFDRLTVAEKRVFVELAKGKPNKIIAYDLSISEATVKAHVSKILKKLKVHSRNRAIARFAPRASE